MRVGQNSVQGGEASAAKQGGKAAPSQEAKRPERAERPERPSPSENHGARTEISAKSKEFAQAKSVASGAPDVREERIAELKKKISDGAYKVDSDAISDRMVDEHLKMSGMS